MVLWTVVPMELVFPDQNNHIKYEQIEYSGVQMEVERISGNQCRIVRVLSTDPQDYLREDLQPGSVLTFKPFIEK